MPERADVSCDWLASIGLLLDNASFVWSFPSDVPDGRDLPDAALDALAEAMLATLTRSLSETTL